MKNLGTIYGYRNKKSDIDPNTIKIGSTMLFLERMCVYKTSERDFNNNTHEIWKFDILDSKYDCYQIDNLIQKKSKQCNMPYKYYDGDGGIEHYYFEDGIEKLIDFFEKNKIVTSNNNMVDVNKLREEIKNINKCDAKNNCHKEDEKKEKKH